MIKEGFIQQELKDTAFLYRKEVTSPDEIESKMQSDLNIPWFKISPQLKALLTQDRR